MPKCPALFEWVQGNSARRQSPNHHLLGFKVHTSWGARNTKGAPNDTVASENWRKSLKSQEFSFADTLQPGKWNEVEINLQETTPEQMGELRVSITSSVAVLGSPKAPAQDDRPPPFGRSSRLGKRDCCELMPVMSTIGDPVAIDRSGVWDGADLKELAKL